MVNLRIYVGTYKKYNEGSIFGKWFDLNDYSDFDHLQQAMRELHKDEQDPEFMFQDYECSSIFTELDLISECYISEDIFEAIEAIEDFCYDIEVVEAYCYSVSSYNEDIHSLLEKVEESYSGEFDSDIGFVEAILEDCGDLPTDLPRYIHINWERTARDLMMDYATSKNHYFRMI